MGAGFRIYGGEDAAVAEEEEVFIESERSGDVGEALAVFPETRAVFDADGDGGVGFAALADGGEADAVGDGGGADGALAGLGVVDVPEDLAGGGVETG